MSETKEEYIERLKKKIEKIRDDLDEEMQQLSIVEEFVKTHQSRINELKKSLREHLILWRKRRKGDVDNGEKL